MIDPAQEDEAGSATTPSQQSPLFDALRPKSLTWLYEPVKRLVGRGLGTMTNDTEFCFKPFSAKELINHVETKLAWLWQDYIAVGDLVVFTAYMKVGKSTLIYPLVLAVARGKDFLNRATTQGAVLVLALEENIRDVKLRLVKLGMTEDDPIYVQPGSFPCKQSALAELENFIVANKVGLVVLDSISAYWEVANENDNAEVIQKVKPLLEITRRTNAAIVLVHHESKYGGQDASGNSRNDGKAIRGASSFLGLVDQALSLGRPTGSNAARRILRAIGRRAESPRELVIELWGDTKLTDPTPYGYKVIGTPDETEKVANQAKIATVISTDQPKTLEQLQKESGVKSDAREILDELVSKGQVLREGKGVKGDPHKWQWKPLPPAGQGAVPQINSFSGSVIDL